MNEAIISIGITLQIIMLMLRKWEFTDMPSGLCWLPTILAIVGLTIAPLLINLLTTTQTWNEVHYTAFALCILQLLLFVVKMTTAQDLSWWVVLMPLLIVFGVILIPLFIGLYMRRTTPEGYF